MLRYDVTIKLRGQWMTVFNVLGTNAVDATVAVQHWAPGAETVSSQQVPHNREVREVFARDMSGRPVEGIGAR